MIAAALLGLGSRLFGLPMVVDMLDDALDDALDVGRKGYAVRRK